MPRLIWARSALSDVQRLRRFLAPKNPDAATRAVKAIRQGVRVFRSQPGIGRPVECMPEYRGWMINFGDSGYIVRYHTSEGDVVKILAIRHQREAGWTE